MFPPSLLPRRYSMREIVEKFVRSKPFDFVIIALVLVYTCIIFAYFALDTKEYEGVKDIEVALSVIQFIELAILIVFCLEIFMRVYAHSA